MFGFVYIIDDLVTGQRYVGQRSAKGDLRDELGLTKFAAHNVRRTIVGVATSQQELDNLELETLLLCQAVSDAHYYGIVSNGHADRKKLHQVVLRWRTMDPTQQQQIAQRLRDWNHGWVKSAEHRAQISIAKRGISNWNADSLEKMANTRRAQIAEGIAIPPHGNRGNKNYRHSETNRQAIKAGVAKARARIAAERDSYFTEAGLSTIRTRLADYYTPFVRQDHAQRIRDGQARRLARYVANGLLPPRFRWYHDPSDPTQRGTFSSEDNVPIGWIAGMGKRAKRDRDK